MLPGGSAFPVAPSLRVWLHPRGKVVRDPGGPTPSETPRRPGPPGGSRHDFAVPDQSIRMSFRSACSSPAFNRYR